MTWKENAVTRVRKRGQSVAMYEQKGEKVFNISNLHGKQNKARNHWQEFYCEILILWVILGNLGILLLAVKLPVCHNGINLYIDLM